MEIKVAYNCAIGQELVLFNNREILIRSQTIFVLQRMVFERNLPFTGSFTGKWPIFCIPEFLQRYEVECNFLNVMTAVSAIPKHLLTKAKEKNIYKCTFLAENAFQHSLNTVIDLHKMRAEVTIGF